MKKFFLDQFFITSINQEAIGKLRLQCFGIHEGNQIRFNLYLSESELNKMLDQLKETGCRIKKWLSRAFMADLVQLFRYAVTIDSCWLTISIIELTTSEKDTDKEYCVENFGFIPE